MRRRTVLGIVTALIGVLAGCVVLEPLSTAWLTIENGAYSSAQALFARTSGSFLGRGNEKSGCTGLDDLFPHPYVAFVHHGDPPCGAKNTNNIGLYGPDFPTQKRMDRYVVLLTGGSVAAAVGQSNLKSPRFLEEALNRRYLSPNGKPFLVLTGAEGGWKEPQQFILFSLYAPLIDAVVSLDGYNEYILFGPTAKMALEQKLSLDAPNSQFVAVNPLFRGDFSDLAMGWMIARAARAIESSALLSRSHAAYLLYRALMGQAHRWDVMQYDRGVRMDTMFGLPKEMLGDSDKIFAEQLRRYQSYKISTAAVAAAHGVKSACFLAPIPSWGKTLSDEEKKHVGDTAYLGRYRELVADMMTLRRRGLAMFDLGDVFKDVKGTIYDDHIHCVIAADGTSRGYELMAARMAQDVAEAWGLQPKP